MAMFNLIRLTTFSVGTIARMVFTVTCTIVAGRALSKSDHYTLSHYAPEFEEGRFTYHEAELSKSKMKKVLSWISSRRVVVGLIARFIATIELLKVRA